MSTNLHIVQLISSIISRAKSFISVSDSLSSDLRLREELSDLMLGVGEGVWDLNALGESRRGLLGIIISSSRIWQEEPASTTQLCDRNFWMTRVQTGKHQESDEPSFLEYLPYLNSPCHSSVIQKENHLNYQYIFTFGNIVHRHCFPAHKVLYHTHTHTTVKINMRKERVAWGLAQWIKIEVYISGKCFMW